MAVYSQRQVGIRFSAVLEDITDPDNPDDYDPGDAGPNAPALVMVFRRPDGYITERGASRSRRDAEDPDGAANDDTITYTTTADDPLIAGYPGVWHRTARARMADGTIVVASPDWIAFEVI